MKPYVFTKQPTTQDALYDVVFGFIFGVILVFGVVFTGYKAVLELAYMAEGESGVGEVKHVAKTIISSKRNEVEYVITVKSPHGNLKITTYQPYAIGEKINYEHLASRNLARLEGDTYKRMLVLGLILGILLGYLIFEKLRCACAYFSGNYVLKKNESI